MRQIKCKGLRKEVYGYTQRKGFGEQHSRQIYQKVKKGYNKTPRTIRDNFAIYE